MPGIWPANSTTSSKLTNSQWYCSHPESVCTPMLSKQVYTQQALQNIECDIDLAQALDQWWWHSKSTGLRLTAAGHAVFAKMLDLESWQFDIPQQSLNASTLITLDRKLSCPYYLDRKRGNFQLTMFGSREAMMAVLYGDIQRFIASLTG